MPMKIREVVRLLEASGWREIRVRGSQRQFRHPDGNLVITVPGNSGRELAPGTLNDIEEGRLEMNVKRNSIVIERTTTGFSAWSPDVSGCAAVGDTEEETSANMQEVLVFHLEGMREVGEAIPEPGSSVRYIDVAA